MVLCPAALEFPVPITVAASPELCTREIKDLLLSLTENTVSTSCIAWLSKSNLARDHDIDLTVLEITFWLEREAPELRFNVELVAFRAQSLL